MFISKQSNLSSLIYVLCDILMYLFLGSYENKEYQKMRQINALLKLSFKICVSGTWNTSKNRVCQCFTFFFQVMFCSVLYTTVAYMSRLIKKMCGCDQISNSIYLRVYTVFIYENVLLLWPCGLFKCIRHLVTGNKGLIQYRSIHIRYG